MPASSLSAILALHLAVALFGFAGLFGKWLALSPVLIVLGRTLVAAAALAPLTVLQRTLKPPEPGLIVNGALLAAHWLAFFAAIQAASVAIGLLGYASFPLFVLLLERLLLGRRWRPGEAVAVLLITVGLVVLVPRFDWREDSVQGLAWGALSGFTFALLVVRNRRFAATHAPATIALWQNAFAAIALLPLLVIGRDALPQLTLRDLGLLLALGLLCTALAHTLFIASMRDVSAHTASVAAALEPVYGIVLAAALLDETPTVRTLAGAALIVGAALYATLRPGRQL